MPKENINISNFQAGVISNVSERDIPIDAASESLNIDVTGEKGSLRGTYADSIVVDGGSNDFPLYQESAVINNDGTHIMVGWKPRSFANVQIRQVSALQNPFTDSSPTEISSTTLDADATNNHLCCMEVNNKEVHIGFGNNPSKWVGIVQYKQFGKENNTQS